MEWLNYVILLGSAISTIACCIHAVYHFKVRKFQTLFFMILNNLIFLHIPKIIQNIRFLLHNELYCIEDRVLSVIGIIFGRLLSLNVSKYLYLAAHKCVPEPEAKSFKKDFVASVFCTTILTLAIFLIQSEELVEHYVFFCAAPTKPLIPILCFYSPLLLVEFCTLSYNCICR